MLPLGWGGGPSSPLGWGAAAKRLGQGLLAVSPQLCPFGELGCSIPAWIPSRTGHGDALSPELRCPFCLLSKGSLMDLRLSGRLPSLPRCLRGGGSLCTLRSRLPGVPPG